MAATPTRKIIAVISVRVSFYVGELVIIREGIPGLSPSTVVVVAAVALVVVIAANTAMMAYANKEYRWWYGLIKMAFYFGSFILTMASAGMPAAIASVSTFLGMELNKLAQIMHRLGILPRLVDAFGRNGKDKEAKNTAKR